MLSNNFEEIASKSIGYRPCSTLLEYRLLIPYLQGEPARELTFSLKDKSKLTDELSACTSTVSGHDLPDC